MKEEDTKWKRATWTTIGDVYPSGHRDGSDPSCDNENYPIIVSHCNPDAIGEDKRCGMKCGWDHKACCGITACCDSASCSVDDAKVYTIPCLSSDDYKKNSSIKCEGPGQGCAFKAGIYAAFINGDYPKKYVTWDNIQCTTKYYNTNQDDFNRYAKAWGQKHKDCKPNSNNISFLKVPDPDDPDKTIKAAMSLGHGLFESSCGGFVLVRFKTVGMDDYKYIINFQVGVRTWSFENNAYKWIKPDNLEIAPTSYCEVFDAVELSWDDIGNVQDVVSYKCAFEQ